MVELIRVEKRALEYLDRERTRDAEVNVVLLKPLLVLRVMGSRAASIVVSPELFVGREGWKYESACFAAMLWPERLVPLPELLL